MADSDTRTTYKPPPLPPGVTAYKPPPLPPGVTAPSTDRPSAGAAFVTGGEYGLLDPIYGGAQIGARMGPDEGGAAFADYDELAARRQAVDKAVEERNKRYYAEPAVKAHPYVAGAGDIAGQAVTTLPVTIPAGGAIAAAPTLPLRALGSGVLGSGLALLEPTDNFSAGKKALQAGLGFVGGALGQPAGELIGKGVGAATKWLGGKLSETVAARNADAAAEKASRQASEKISKTFRKEKGASGTSADDVVEQIMKARAAGQPMALWDIGEVGGPARRLAGVASRSSGEARETMELAQKRRISEQTSATPTADDPSTLRTAQSNRIVDKVREIFGWKSVEGQTERGRIDRSVTGKPLWDEAMEGGSVAPLEHQFEQQFQEATTAEAVAAQKLREAQTRLVSAQAKQQTSAAAQREAATTPAQVRARELGAAGKEAVTGAAPPEASPSAFNKELVAAQRDAEAAEKELAQIRQTKEENRTQLAQAQADGSINRKGAVWSPHLQRLFNRPDVRRGLNAGYKLQEDLAAARNEPFNPYEWGIKGIDAEGNPIVERVPNMRMIQVAKQGLDHLLESPEFRDPLTRKLNQRGLAIDEMRRALLSEGDRLNPDWAKARNQWAGDTAMLEALRDGQFAFKRPSATGQGWSTAEFTKRWNEMGEGERENFLTGVGNHMIEDLDYQLHNGDPTKALIRGNATRNKLLTMFKGDEKKLDSFVEFVEREAKMHQTGSSVMRGSQTGERRVADQQAGIGELVSIGQHLLHGHPFRALTAAGARAVKSIADKVGAEQRQAVLGEVAKQITDPNIELRVGPKGQLLVGPQLPTSPGVAPYVGQATGDLSGLLFGERPR